MPQIKGPKAHDEFGALLISNPAAQGVSSLVPTGLFIKVATDRYTGVLLHSGSDPLCRHSLGNRKCRAVAQALSAHPASRLNASKSYTGMSSTRRDYEITLLTFLNAAVTLMPILLSRWPPD